jgi:hypothetical protein
MNYRCGHRHYSPSSKLLHTMKNIILLHPSFLFGIEIDYYYYYRTVGRKDAYNKGGKK